MSEAAAIETLYPFLADDRGVEEPVRASALRAALLASAIDKFDESRELRHATIAEHRDALVTCAHELAKIVTTRGTVYTAGNGGSATDAAETARLLPGSALALSSDTAVLTALSNDIGYERALGRHLRALGRADDAFIAISTSGSSRNLVDALGAARGLGMTTVAFSGYDGGAFSASGLVDHHFVVRSSSVHRIQEAQTAVLRVLVQLVRAALPPPIADAAPSEERDRHGREG